jgi:hypothetical protein
VIYRSHVTLFSSNFLCFCFGIYKPQAISLVKSFNHL